MQCKIPTCKLKFADTSYKYFGILDFGLVYPNFDLYYVI